jgi:predicted membrane protein DUF2142
MRDLNIGQPHLLAVAFVLYGLVATAFLAINMPPFQNVDEQNHFLRAAQVADGGLVGSRFSTRGVGSSPTTAGGWADPAIMTAFAQFDAVRFHSDKRVTQASGEPRVYWSGERMMLSFPNTVNYPPFFYVPSAVGILLGRSAKMTIVQTLEISRVLTGIAAISVGAAAIVCAGGAAVWIFMILTPAHFAVADRIVVAGRIAVGSCVAGRGTNGPGTALAVGGGLEIAHGVGSDDGLGGNGAATLRCAGDTTVCTHDSTVTIAHSGSGCDFRMCRGLVRDHAIYHTNQRQRDCRR